MTEYWHVTNRRIDGQTERHLATAESVLCIAPRRNTITKLDITKLQQKFYKIKSKKLNNDCKTQTSSAPQLPPSVPSLQQLHLSTHLNDNSNTLYATRTHFSVLTMTDITSLLATEPINNYNSLIQVLSRSHSAEINEDTKQN